MTEKIGTTLSTTATNASSTPAPSTSVSVSASGSGVLTSGNPWERGAEIGKHLLSRPYVLWFTSKAGRAAGRNLSSSADAYEKNIHKLAEFTCVEEFWAVYSHILRPSDVPPSTDYHLFRAGTKPMWEDANNKNGGKWIIRVKKGVVSRYWEALMLAVIGDQFDVGDELCGCVVSVRFQEDLISVWNRNASNLDVNNKIRDTIKRCLELPHNTVVEYKRHNDSMRDHSSFRHTDVSRLS